MNTTLIYKENGKLCSIPDCKDDMSALIQSGVDMDDLITVVVRTVIHDTDNLIKANLNLYDDVVEREIIYDRNDKIILEEYMSSLGFEYIVENDIYIFRDNTIVDTVDENNTMELL